MFLDDKIEINLTYTSVYCKTKMERKLFCCHYHYCNLDSSTRGIKTKLNIVKLEYCCQDV